MLQQSFQFFYWPSCVRKKYATILYFLENKGHFFKGIVIDKHSVADIH